MHAGHRWTRFHFWANPQHPQCIRTSTVLQRRWPGNWISYAVWKRGQILIIIISLWFSYLRIIKLIILIGNEMIESNILLIDCQKSETQIENAFWFTQWMMKILKWLFRNFFLFNYFDQIKLIIRNQCKSLIW